MKGYLLLALYIKGIKSKTIKFYINSSLHEFSCIQYPSVCVCVCVWMSFVKKTTTTTGEPISLNSEFQMKNGCLETPKNSRSSDSYLVSLCDSKQKVSTIFCIWCVLFFCNIYITLLSNKDIQFTLHCLKKTFLLWKFVILEIV